MLADYLLLRHHSGSGQVNQAEALGLITRSRDLDDRRVVRLILASEGAHRLEELSKLRVEQLRRLATNFSDISQGLDPVHSPHGLLK